MPKRKILYSALITPGLLAATLAATSLQPVPANEKPNILWILTDQQNLDSISAYKTKTSSWIKSPNLDKLAENGTLFENCYVASPVCVPSRVSILTGLYPNQTGVYYNTDISSEWPNSITTFPEILAENGYKTANFGKVHTPKHDTYQQSTSFATFDEVTKQVSFGTLYSAQEHEIVQDKSKSGAIRSGIYPYHNNGETPTSHVIDSSFAWIKNHISQNADTPFMFRVSILAPHAPFLPPKEYYDMYDPKDMIFTLPNEQELDFVAPLYKEYTPEQLMRFRATYFGLTTYVDYEIGRLLKGLSEMGLDKNTIIVFTSDHGHMLGEHGQMDKGNFYQEAVKVPLIISGPNIPKNQRISDLKSSIDISRTLLRLAGVKVPDQFKASAKDLFTDHRTEVYGEIGATWVRKFVSDGKYTLSYVSFNRNGDTFPNAKQVKGQLFDLENDEGQFNNLYSNLKYASVVESLTQKAESALPNKIMQVNK